MSLDYLFNTGSSTLQKGDQAILFFALACLALAIVFKLSAVKAPSPIDQAFRGKLFSIFLTLGIAEIIWVGLRYQNVRFFGTNFVAWIIILIYLVWFLVALIKTFSKYSIEKQAWEKEQVKAKYLPK